MASIFFTLLVVFIVASLTYVSSVSLWRDARVNWRDDQLKRHEALIQAERRRNFKRQLFPALEYPPTPAIAARLPLSETIGWDLGAMTSCEVVLDGETVYSPTGDFLASRTGTQIHRLADVEAIAKAYPHQEWLVRFIKPVQSLVYQRHADGEWNLIKVERGMS